MKMLRILFAVGVAMLSTYTANAQTSNVLIVHNSADPAAAFVDVYAAGSKIIDNFPFRFATNWLKVPANIAIPISINESTSSSAMDKVLGSFNTPQLVADKNYIVVANGVKTPSEFTSGPNQNVALSLFPIADVDSVSRTAKTTDIYAFHGATDAPGVDLYAVGVAQPLVSDLRYGQSGKISVPSEANAIYTLNLSVAGSPSTIVRSYKLPTEESSNSSLFVFASGFLDPSKNKNGKSLELFAVSLSEIDGSTQRAVRLPSTDFDGKDATLQIIHNCPEPAADEVDVYLNGVLALDNFAFRKATPFLPLLGGVQHTVSINLPTSTSEFDKAVSTFDIELKPSNNYYGIASGTLDNNGFTPIQARDVAFTIIGVPAQVSSTNANALQAAVFHGSPDAPKVDVWANNQKVSALAGLDYGKRSPYIDLPPATYVIGVAPENGNPIVTYDLSIPESAKGASALVVASGYLAPTGAKQNKTFKLLVILPNGDVQALQTSTTSVEENIVDNSAVRLYPNPANNQIACSYEVQAQGVVRISLINALGNTVAEINEGTKERGTHTTMLDVSALPNGTYSIVTNTANSSTVKQLVVLK